MISKENKDKLLKGVIEIAKLDSDFKNKLLIALGASIDSHTIKEDIRAIRKALLIEADPSLDFGFIPDKYEKTRTQLLVDNMRMENCILDAKVGDAERLFNFTVYAWYQIENLINYYFHIKNNGDIIKIAKDLSINKVEYEAKIHREIKTIADIEANIKIKIFNDRFFCYPDKSYTDKKTGAPKEMNITQKNISDIRQVRNQGLHRCMVILDGREEKLDISNFFKYQTPEKIRNTLKTLTHTIKINLD